MIVGLCGYGYTGSGAVLDILKEYDLLNIVENFELELIYKPDGIETLEYFLMKSPSRFFGSDTAIRRFLNFAERMKLYYDPVNKGREFMRITNEYVERLIQVRWKGTCSFHSVECGKFTYHFKYGFIANWGRRAKKYLKIKNGEKVTDIEMYLSIRPEQFYEETKNYLRKLLELNPKYQSGMTTVLDQPFSADNPYKSFIFFDDPYAILVEKDPRDMYLLAKMELGHRCSFIPTDSVDDFIHYYRQIMQYRDDCRQNVDNVLYLNFESLVYDEELSRKKIEDFLGIKDKNGKQFFFAEKSINNTQLFLKYPEMKEDIQKIETELSKWLFDFSKYDRKPVFDIRSF